MMNELLEPKKEYELLPLPDEFFANCNYFSSFCTFAKENDFINKLEKYLTAKCVNI